MSERSASGSPWLTDDLHWDSVFSSLLDAVSSRARTTVGGLCGASLAIAAAAMHRLAGPTLVVLPSLREAEAMRDDLRALLSGVLFFPDYETLPWEGEPAHPSVIADRVECLAGLLSASPGTVVVVPAQALVKKLPPPESFRTLRIYRGMRLSMDELEAWFTAAGYSREDSVSEQGRWARRGGVVDAGTFGMDNPVRIEFFGDEAESIRLFDIRTQRSIREVPSAVLLPAREAFLDHGHWDRAISLLPPEHPLASRMITSNSLPGLEHMLPLFYEKLALLPDYLASIGTLILVEPERVAESLEETWSRQTEGFPDSLPFGPADQFSLPGETMLRLDACERVVEAALMPRGDVDAFYHTLPQESFLGHPEEMVRQFGEWLGRGFRIGIACDSRAEKEAFESLLPPGMDLDLEIMSISEGFRMPEQGLVVLAERRLLSGRKRPGVVRRFRGGEAVAGPDDLSPGAFVVHRQYGIGIFRGLERVVTGDEILDCLAIEYAGGDRLLVPSSEIGAIHRYMTPGESRPELDRIGTGFWTSRVTRARGRAREIAGRLAVIYSERRSARRPPPGPPGPLMQALEETFPFEETPDQAAAIAMVRQDLQSERPMDRLICGDVGYGKTEVALRAAFRVADSGRQVAVLAPTTILAEQHFQTFRDRMAEFPVNVECLSRFKSPSEQRRILDGLADGSVDIVVGTHRLLQKDVRFDRLGLLVIDEEHRFGVRQKECIRELKSSVDTLAMTATPIPRTLHMALSGFQDISIIATPPRDRYPIHTELIEWNPALIRKAVERELEREGQIFFVHNRINTMEEVRRELLGFLPDVRICTAHGRMRSEDLESVMHAFMEGEFDMLLSTAIIESGLDLPRVNTIFIDEAHTFGMADLYQLRGRVGRSYHRAYCYLIRPAGPGALGPEGRNRLESIQRFTELGSGWHVAMRDLEIRGAGELLGARQHGHMESIGYSLFEDLIREEAALLRGSRPASALQVRVEIPGESFLPEDYMPDIVERVRLYRILWSALAESDIEDWKSFVRDRFGELPAPASNCVERARIRLLAAAAGVEEVNASARLFRLVLVPGSSVSRVEAGLGGWPGAGIRVERTGRVVVSLPLGSGMEPGGLPGRLADALRRLA